MNLREISGELRAAFADANDDLYRLQRDMEHHAEREIKPSEFEVWQRDGLDLKLRFNRAQMRVRDLRAAIHQAARDQQTEGDDDVS